MTYHIKLDQYMNDNFYREASRGTVETVNESEGLKYMISAEIKHIRNEIARQLAKDVKITLSNEMGEWIVTGTYKDK